MVLLSYGFTNTYLKFYSLSQFGSHTIHPCARILVFYLERICIAALTYTGEKERNDRHLSIYL